MVACVPRKLAALVALFFFATPILDCAAQNRGNVSVQLPTFHQFGVSTTVVVPDRGSIYLGGVNRASRGRSRFGPGIPGLGNRGLGRTSLSAGVSVSATIIDHDEIDRALLAEAARQRGAQFDVRGRPIADAPRLSADVVGQRWRRTLDRQTRTARSRSLPLQDQSATADASRVATYMSRAARAEADGQPQLAKVFYQRVVKHSEGALKQQAEARLEQIASTAKVVR